MVTSYSIIYKGYAISLIVCSVCRERDKSYINSICLHLKSLHGIQRVRLHFEKRRTHTSFSGKISIIFVKHRHLLIIFIAQMSSELCKLRFVFRSDMKDTLPIIQNPYYQLDFHSVEVMGRGNRVKNRIK